VTYRAFACSANRSKGDEVCPNRVQISERKAIAALVATVRWSLAHPRFRERFEATFRRVWAAAEEPALPAQDDGVRALEAKLARLVALVEDAHGDVAALTRRMRELEAQIRDARAHRAAAARPRPARALPDPARVLAAFEDLEGTLAASPAHAREALAARFEPVVLTPKPDGSGYRLQTALKTTPAALVAQGGREVRYGGSCGGRI
jgi:hypothetical protein